MNGSQVSETESTKAAERLYGTPRVTATLALVAAILGTWWMGVIAVSLTAQFFLFAPLVVGVVSCAAYGVVGLINAIRGLRRYLVGACWTLLGITLASLAFGPYGDIEGLRHLVGQGVASLLDPREVFSVEVWNHDYYTDLVGVSWFGSLFSLPLLALCLVFLRRSSMDSARQ